MKITGRRVALSSVCLGVAVIVAAALVSRSWISKQIASLRPEEPWVARIRTTLDQQMLTVSFSQRSLNQVVPFLSDQTGIKIAIDPAVNPSQRMVSLQAKDLKARELLDVLMLQTGLTYDFRDNGIYILEKPGGR